MDITKIDATNDHKLLNLMVHEILQSGKKHVRHGLQEEGDLELVLTILDPDVEIIVWDVRSLKADTAIEDIKRVPFLRDVKHYVVQR